MCQESSANSRKRTITERLTWRGDSIAKRPGRARLSRWRGQCWKKRRISSVRLRRFRMKRLSLPFLAAFCLLTIPYTSEAQPTTKTQSVNQSVVSAKEAAADKAARDAEAARILAERRTQARSLLLSLAADARNFSDQTLRART